MLPVLYHSTLAPTNSDNPNRVTEFFDRFFREHAAASSNPGSTVPLCMWEDEQALHIELDTPGISEAELDISVHQGVLFIKGERKFERKNNGIDNRYYGCFEQRIRLPHWAKADEVEAQLQSGVLSIRFPKGDEAKPRKIAVKNS